ncbi:hypothetical protein [Nocardioides sp.]|uniref:hypothetical protein n=1 Tax=Nocardioides sp. TaxID=35761 RepID=UPI0039E38573
MEELTVVVDLEVDFHSIDETGYVWAWLKYARDPSVIQPGEIIVVGDDDALAMGRVVDLVEEANGTVVHVDVLPGSVGGYFKAVARSAATV